jgi:hypothetical protein
MNRKFLSGISLAGMMLFGTYTLAQNPPQQQDQDKNQQQQQSTKSVSGKVTNIGDDRRSFTLQPDTSNNTSQKGPMEFQVDDHTQVRGRVTTGTMVTVEYTPGEGGKYLAVSIAPQGGGSGQ